MLRKKRRGARGFAYVKNFAEPERPPCVEYIKSSRGIVAESATAVPDESEQREERRPQCSAGRTGSRQSAKQLQKRPARAQRSNRCERYQRVNPMNNEKAPRNNFTPWQLANLQGERGAAAFGAHKQRTASENNKHERREGAKGPHLSPERNQTKGAAGTEPQHRRARSGVAIAEQCEPNQLEHQHRRARNRPRNGAKMQAAASTKKAKDMGRRSGAKKQGKRAKSAGIARARDASPAYRERLAN
eukprot:g20160.t1